MGNKLNLVDRCPVCRGTGHSRPVQKTCPACRGLSSATCPVCAGKGKVLRTFPCTGKGCRNGWVTLTPTTAPAPGKSSVRGPALADAFASAVSASSTGKRKAAADGANQLREKLIREGKIKA